MVVGRLDEAYWKSLSLLLGRGDWNGFDFCVSVCLNNVVLMIAEGGENQICDERNDLVLDWYLHMMTIA